MVNPQLASYLFDASKATKLENEVIKKRIEQIRKCQLNESLNESQIRAIAKAVEAKDLAIIQGPPGYRQVNSHCRIDLAIGSAKAG
ncbi:MAG: hypothetical protein ACLSHL_09695 [Alistipes communis]